MGDFTDFDDLLKKERQRENTTQQQKRQALLNSRKEWDGNLKRLISLFKEYNETILQPREPMFVILKKEELIDHLPSKGKPIFTYVINGIPKKLLPHAFNPFYAETGYVTPDKITKDDWYVKVALQCEITLSENAKNEHLFTDIYLRVWGLLDTKEQSLVPSSFEITTHEAWRLPFTRLHLQSNSPQSKTITEDFKRALMIMTPKVFTHLKEVFGLEL